jgi:hypothetical protein
LIEILRKRSADSTGDIFCARAALPPPTVEELTEAMGRSEEAV